MKFKQTPKDKTWTDESGTEIPYNRTTPAERLREKYAFALLSEAETINQRATAFKAKITELVQEVIDAAREENAVKLEGKGNYTWYNFNRTIKIEVNVNEQISFDELTIESAKEKLMELIRQSITGDDFIITLVEDAFQTSRGKLDPKKILGLRRHTERIRNAKLKAEWSDIMTLIDKSISRPSSKTYFKVWKKNEEGKYEGVELNFSAL
ncbi:hypothetical protein CO230_08800 [Chryseobacterium sp. 6424]|uniref:DUF3164 family protein n=1 Tax=Chryseobacterium sp. 6424 TaxID=2039166 RepID=UPI000EFB1E65|nr:DUF3164 family protein [Chryseobacterium sp. 6424]AYO58213.1 hypothetical protein CO230_08800 [Chryseobacterium sp. 6424]